MTKTIAGGRIVDEDGVIQEPEGQELSEVAATGMLAQYLDIRKQRDTAQKALDHIAQVLKPYIERNGELYDGERGIRGALQVRKGADELDAAHMPEELLRWLADQHCLALKGARWKGLDGAAPEVLRVKDFLSPGAGSTALLVQKEDD